MIKIPLRLPRRGAYVKCKDDKGYCKYKDEYIHIYGQLPPFTDRHTWWYGAYEDDPYNEIAIMADHMHDIHWRIDI